MEMGPDDPLTREELEGLRKAVLADDSIVPVPQAVLRTLLAGYQAPGRVELLDMAEERCLEFLQRIEDEREEEPRCDFAHHLRVADFTCGPENGCSMCGEQPKHANHRFVVICREDNGAFFKKIDERQKAAQEARESTSLAAAEMNRVAGPWNK